jgi:hypothetical protein
MMFDSLRVAIYRFTLQAGEKGLVLPAWKGSTFRGGFGHVFKRLACVYLGQECAACLAPSVCAYGKVFETSPNGQEGGFMGGYDQVPRPYLIETPLERQTEYEPGEMITVRLKLFGQAVDYAPIFITTFRELGKEGIGTGRRSYRLLHAESEGLNGYTRTVYLDGAEQFHAPVIFTGEDIRNFSRKVDVERKNRATVFFDTPVRVKWQGRYTSDPMFHLIIRNLVRRGTGLLRFHHGVEIEGDVRGLIQRAERVRMVRQEVRWMDQSRYSARQDTKMKLGGFVGWAQYEGDLEEFLPWLRLGEVIHVGKNTVFDLGRIRVG